MNFPPARSDDHPFIPPPKGIRERFIGEWASVEELPNSWPKGRLTITDRERGEVVAEIDRNYAPYNTFEPFWHRQDDIWHPYALVSPDYTATSVVDLMSGRIVVGEKRDTFGFCPVDFRVLDWWDVHDGSVMPGSQYWDDSDELPDGTFGFVAGCIWGDDSSWKVQFLDLRFVHKGALGRDERYGYVELPYGIDLKDAITLREGGGVSIAARLDFKADGTWDEWQRGIIGVKTEDDEASDVSSN